MNSKWTGDYNVKFISQHPNDNSLCDDKSRWWHLLREYKNDKNDVTIYGAHILFGPKHKPDSNKHILWTEPVPLTNPSCYLRGPFNFDTDSDMITFKQHVALTHWEYL